MSLQFHQPRQRQAAEQRRAPQTKCLATRHAIAILSVTGLAPKRYSQHRDVSWKGRGEIVHYQRLPPIQ